VQSRVTGDVRPGPACLEDATDWLRKAFRPEASPGVRVRCRVDLRGEGGGSLLLRVDRGRLEVGSADDEQAPDVVFRISAGDFFGMLAGRENPDLLFMADRLSIDGDLSLALKLRKLFNAPT
jgi:predicted lipid carrier protein YhbT